MTMHEADRPAEYDSVEEEDELGGRDVLTDEQRDPMTGTDVDVAEADLEEPGDDEADTTRSREDLAADEGAFVEPELVEADEAGEPAAPDPVVAGRTPASGPVEKLAPVDPDSAVDPGTGSYEDRWGGIQAGFIDDPRRTVESASALVAEMWDEIARAMTDEREGIDDRWRTTECSTDDLRAAMQDYRTLYTRSLHFASGE